MTTGWVPRDGAGLEKTVLDPMIISMMTSRKAGQTEAGHGGREEQEVPACCEASPDQLHRNKLE